MTGKHLLPYLPALETENIVLEHLGALRADVSQLKSGQREILEQLFSARLREHAQDNKTNSDNRRPAHVEAEVERIKRRLDMVGSHGGA